MLLSEKVKGAWGPGVNAGASLRVGDCVGWIVGDVEPGNGGGLKFCREERA